MRDEHVPTDEKRALVRALAKYGVRQHDIAVQIGVATTATLTKYYRAELDAGMAEAAEGLAKTAYQMAMDGDVRMMIFLLKTRLGYRETTHIECSGPDGAPIQTEQAIRVTFVRPHKRAGRPKKCAEKTE